MQNLSKKIFEQYQTRKTKEQKTEFIEMLTRELEAEGHQVKVETAGRFKSRNIIVGDLEKCEIVLGAHYDTAPVLPFPNFLAPKNILVYVLFILGLTVIMSIIETAMLEFILMVTDSFLAAFLAPWIFLIVILVCLFCGKANTHTANDNTSGVITLVEALYDRELAGKVCCVFFDHEEIGLFGSSAFAKKHKELMKDKLLFNFDCVSDGDTIMLVVSRAAMRQRDLLEQAFSAEPESRKQFLVTKSTTTLYPSDQMNFKTNVGVAAFKRNKLFGYYMDRIHTKRDVIFEEENIEMIVGGLKQFLNV